MKTNINIKKFFVVTFLALLFACSHKEEVKVEKTPEKLYEDSYNALTQENDYKKAAKGFAELTHEFPYYADASKAHVMEIYAYYLQKDYDSAIFASENYIKVFPASKYVPYIYYIKAISYYDQIDIPYRDQGVTRKARGALLDIITRFPESIYKRDAKMKLDLVEDHLAAQEMITGRYYMNKGDIVAAIKRFDVIVKEYSRTSQIEEALYRLAEGYMFIGQKQEANKYVVVLKLNYPDGEWYARALNLAKE